MEIRSLFGPQEQFSTFNREERNCVAMLYHVLLQGGNLGRFLDGRKWDGQVDWDRYELAVEWSYLRDLWHLTAGDQALRRRIIERGLDLLDGLGGGGADTIAGFNAFYGASPKASSAFIQSPATWHLPRLDEHITDNDLLLKACKFKWAFRVRPDLVVTDGERLLCVEAKWESGESRYPISTAERKIFARRGLGLTLQTDLQRFLLTEVLGFDARFVFLVRHPTTAPTDDTITWAEAFERLDLTDEPPFIKNWVAALETAGI